MSPVLALLKARLTLVCARLLLICLGQVLRRTADVEADVESDDVPGQPASMENASFAAFASRVSRRAWSGTQAYCRTRIARVREQRGRGVEQARTELQSVLEELRQGWHALNERVAGPAQPPNSGTPAQPARADAGSEDPPWVREALARSRTVLHRPSDDAQSAPVEPDSPAPRSAVERDAIAAPLRPAAKRPRGTDGYAGASPIDAPPTTNGRAMQALHASQFTDGFSASSTVASPPYFPPTDAATQHADGTDAAAPKRSDQHRNWHAEADDAALVAAPGADDNLWPSLPDEPETMPANVTGRSADESDSPSVRERQRVLETEQRGRPWSG